MKRLTAILLALTLILASSLLTACKKDADDNTFALCEGVSVRFDPETAEVKDDRLTAKDGSWSLVLAQPLATKDEFDSAYDGLAASLADEDVTVSQKTIGSYDCTVVVGPGTDTAFGAMYICVLGEGAPAYSVTVGFSLDSEDALPAAEAVLATLTVA